MSQGFQSPGGRASSDSAAQSAIPARRRKPRAAEPSLLVQAGAESFNAPAEQYAEGHVTGTRMACELLLRLQQSPGSHPERLRLRNMLRDVGVSTQPGGVSSAPTADHAAYAFLSVMTDMVCFAVTQADVERYTATRLDTARANSQGWNDYLAKNRADFLARMAAGKARKRQQQLAQTGGAA